MQKNKSAFTLLEVILTMAITSLVLITIYTVFSMGIRVYKRVESQIDIQTYEVLTQLSQELRSAYLIAAEDSPFEFIGTSTAVSFVTVASLRHNFNPSQTDDLREVSYYLGPSDDENKHSLMYKINFNPGRVLAKEKKLQLLAGLNILRFSYYDGQQWKNIWKSNNQLPKAVQIFIQLEDRTNELSLRNFSVTVDIPTS
jgi:prepilin-type N-terminal cleavage/methylation domain-containing protein